MRKPRMIVGVVAAVRGTGMDKQPQPTLYIPLAQSPRNQVTFAMRTSGDPMALAGALKSAIWRVDRDQPIFEIRSMREIVENSGAGSRLAFTLLIVFAASALVLAAVGIYGVVSYTVNQRTQEIGLRMALGAGARETLLLILRGSLTVALAGVLAGFLLAVQLRRVIARLLFDTSPTDPVTFAAVGAVLIIVALSAAWFPARRASRIDPLVALRYE
jgi:putative ABC transport system permease protein